MKLIKITIACIIVSTFYLPLSQASDVENIRLKINAIADNIEARCKVNYNEQIIKKAKLNLPESERERTMIQINIRKDAECVCMPQKLRDLSNKTIAPSTIKKH